MYILSPKTTTKITKQKVKPTKKINWNYKKYSLIQKRVENKEERTKNRWEKQEMNSKIMDSDLTILINIFNVNGLNTPIKRQRLSYCKKKNRAQPYAVYKKCTLNRKAQIG